jgi:hypothetical protein
MKNDLNPAGPIADANSVPAQKHCWEKVLLLGTRVAFAYIIIVVALG